MSGLKLLNYISINCYISWLITEIKKLQELLLHVTSKIQKFIHFGSDDL